MVTKSGSNQLHGTAFYYLRDSSFGATLPFLAFKPHNRQQQVGGTLAVPSSATRFSSLRDSISTFSTSQRRRVSWMAVRASCHSPVTGSPTPGGDYEATDQALVFAAACSAFFPG